MKKLGKLSINQSKLLENEELVNLRGGYGYYDKFHNNELACWSNGVKTGPIIVNSGCNGDPDNDLGICNRTYTTRAQMAVCVL